MACKQIFCLKCSRWSSNCWWTWKGFAVVAQDQKWQVENAELQGNEKLLVLRDATSKAKWWRRDFKWNDKRLFKSKWKYNQTINLIRKITKCSKEQQIGVEQINDAINSLDKRNKKMLLLQIRQNDIAKKTSYRAKNHK